MNIIRIVVLTMLVSTLISPIIIARPQRTFFIGLNMVVEFIDGGIARVTLKQHPFDINGTSLILDEDVVEEVLNEEESTINLMLLFFTSNPTKTRYSIISHTHFNPEEEVFSNIGVPGVMERFRGALILIIDIFLNSTSEFVKLGEDTYQVSITDYFTLRSPESWIDVMEVRFTGKVELLNFSTEPVWAKPPSVIESNCLKWVNLNEAEAPDSYVLTLKIPGVVFSKHARSLKAAVSEAFFNANSTLHLKIRNTGFEEGFFIVSVSEPCCEQSRKIFLKPGEECWLKFPIYASETGRVEVRIYGEGNKLFEEEVLLKAEKSGWEFFFILGLSGIALTILGALCISMAILKSRKPPPSIAEPSDTSIQDQAKGEIKTSAFNKSEK
ncbi:MAG: hypothetical protein FGF52_04910 [Candidatus Brockarchaeota archaeon]|nr:hypothetical protein [Candidatus Brockarchaeota archaeon]